MSELTGTFNRPNGRLMMSARADRSHCWCRLTSCLAAVLVSRKLESWTAVPVKRILSLFRLNFSTLSASTPTERTAGSGRGTASFTRLVARRGAGAAVSLAVMRCRLRGGVATANSMFELAGGGVQSGWTPLTAAICRSWLRYLSTSARNVGSEMMSRRTTRRTLCTSSIHILPEYSAGQSIVSTLRRRFSAPAVNTAARCESVIFQAFGLRVGIGDVQGSRTIVLPLRSIRPPALGFETLA